MAAKFKMAVILLFTNWVDIPNVRQKDAIQYGVQYGCRTLIPNISPSGSVLE